MSFLYIAGGVIAVTLSAGVGLMLVYAVAFALTLRDDISDEVLLRGLAICAPASALLFAGGGVWMYVRLFGPVGFR